MATSSLNFLIPSSLSKQGERKDKVSLFLQPSRYGRGFSLSLSLSASTQDQADPSAGSTPVSDAEKEELAGRLAAAEAEANALRRELAARKGNSSSDLSKLKPEMPEKRIDGTGFRETLFKGTGSEKQQPNRWGLSEAELFLSKGAPTEGASLGGPAMDEEADKIVTRRLAIGVGVSVIAIGLAFFRLPMGVVRPSKPLFFYVVPIIRLRDQLKSIENSSSDASLVRQQLQKASKSSDISKDTFLSAAAWLDGPDAEKASSLTYEIYDYLNQADYDQYFETRGSPSTSQQLEFLQFSLQSIKAAREKVEHFLALIPEETLQAAETQSGSAF